MLAKKLLGNPAVQKAGLLVLGSKLTEINKGYSVYPVPLVLYTTNTKASWPF